MREYGEIISYYCLLCQSKRWNLVVYWILESTTRMERGWSAICAYFAMCPWMDRIPHFPKIGRLTAMGWVQVLGLRFDVVGEMFLLGRFGKSFSTEPHDLTLSIGDGEHWFFTIIATGRRQGGLRGICDAVRLPTASQGAERGRRGNQVLRMSACGGPCTGRSAIFFADGGIIHLFELT